VLVVVVPALVLPLVTEVEHVEQIADRRHIDRHVRIVLARDRAREIVSAMCRGPSAYRLLGWRAPQTACVTRNTICTGGYSGMTDG